MGIFQKLQVDVPNRFGTQSHDFKKIGGQKDKESGVIFSKSFNSQIYEGGGGRKYSSCVHAFE